MTTLREILRLPSPASAVWDAVRDVGAVHRRLVPGFVSDARLEQGARIVTFANGVTAREEIVSVDDAARRLVYAIPRGRFLHYQATVEVHDDGTGSRLTWTIDLLPDEFTEGVRAMMRQGADAICATFQGERQGAGFDPV
jgi:carbon monoxide dehydrogenase subunit G